MNKFLPISFLTALCLPSSAFACDCQNVSLERKVALSEHIFFARITASKLSPDQKFVNATIEVEKALKGKPQLVAGIVAANNVVGYKSETSCPESSLPPGARFLVFTSGRGSVEYGPCTWTQRLRTADDSMSQRIKSLVSSPIAPSSSIERNRPGKQEQASRVKAIGASPVQ